MKSKLYSRTLAVLLSLMLLVGLMPTMAFAADENVIHVGREELTGNADNPAYALTTEDGSVTTEDATADNYNIKWDGSTLTLKNATLTGSCDDGALPLSVERYAIHCENDFTIALVGSNTVKSPGVSDEDKSCASIGIFARQNLIITGYGVLDTTGGIVTATGENKSADSFGIFSPGGSITIEGGKVTATGGEATVSYDGKDTSSIGIYAYSGSVNISSGTVTATGSAASGNDNAISTGISAKAADISGGTVTATGGTVSDASIAQSKGIEANDIEITGGTVKAAGDLATGKTGVSETFSYGISSHGDVKVGNATVTASGDEANCSAGINIANGDITIESGSVTASGGRSNPSASAGIRAESGSVTINGGDVSAAVNMTEGGNADGIYAYGDIAINGGNIDAIGGVNYLADGVDPNYSSGIFSETGNITITGKDTVVNASSGIASNGIAAITAKAGDIVIRGGIVYADGVSSGSEFIEFGNGLRALKDPDDNTGGNIIISGGTVSVIGYTDSLYYEGELIARPESCEITAGVLDGWIVDENTGQPVWDEMAASASRLEGSPFTEETVIARSLTEGKIYFGAAATATDPTEPTDPTDPTDPSTPAGSNEQNGNADKTDNSAQTGDDSNIALWLAMLLVSDTALTGTVLYNRKKKYNR